MRQKFDAGLQVPLALGGVVAGLVLDVLYARLRPHLSAPRTLQIFVALVPAVTTAASILALTAASGVWWSIHLWAGAVVLAAATGWLLSLLAAPAPSISTSSQPTA